MEQRRRFAIPSCDLSETQNSLLSQLVRQSHFFVISVIRASLFAALFVDLIKSNPQIKNLQILDVATEKFIAYASEHTNADYDFEELGLNGYELHGILPHTFFDFLETQISLKSLRLDCFVIESRHVEMLLLLNLKHLELFYCNVDHPPAIALKNNTIESLALISFYNTEASNFEKLCRFIEKCEKLSAVTVFIEPPSRILPEILAEKSEQFRLKKMTCGRYCLGRSQKTAIRGFTLHY